MSHAKRQRLRMIYLVSRLQVACGTAFGAFLKGT